MDIRLAENIRAFRKERRLTQEQFAEVLGVTTGAVYKWESGLSVPELDLIVEMADFFDTSVDVMLGYKMKDNRMEAAVSRICVALRSRDPEALAEAEKALKKYPNSFEVVLNCAEAYLVFGTGSRDEQQLRRALELFEQALILLPQNTDPKVSDLTIYGEMAHAYDCLDEKEKALDIWKEHNAAGIFCDNIGGTLVEMKRFEDAEEYLSASLVGGTASIFNAAAGFIFLFCSRGDYKSARDIAGWMLSVLSGLKKNEGADFLDQAYSVLMILLAYIQILAGSREEAQRSVEEAAGIAARFDSAPDYGVDTMRFVKADKESSMFSTLGASARGSIDNLLTLIGNEDLAGMWKGATENE
ncbi:MAG: helix-turn-helix domain-containing protein [Firmicutes bacterium]|nr:helix-turn-helix domain-containing protein [Bacillota bacterium]